MRSNRNISALKDGTLKSAEIVSFRQSQSVDNQCLFFCQNVTSFTGKEKDSETGFYYFGARYYDPSLSGLFISIDPMADKYPSLSPYAYCAWNPVKLVDPDGKDFDPTTEDKFIKPYENEIKTRIARLDELKKNDKWRQEYQAQYDEYTTILGEIEQMRTDDNNLYSVSTGYDFGDNTTNGMLSYCGKRDGKNNIRIFLASKHRSVFMFMGTLAHELKHAYQFYSGELVFFCDENMKQIGSSDTKVLEREAHIREDMFRDCVTNGRPMRYNYNINASSYVLPSLYDNYPDDKSSVTTIGKYVIKNIIQ